MCFRDANYRVMWELMKIGIYKFTFYFAEPKTFFIKYFLCF